MNFFLKFLHYISLGEHHFESPKPSLILSKRATFSDVFKHSATLYYHKKSEKFLEKIAQIDVVLFFKEQKKIAGFAKFDLSSYVNSKTPGFPIKFSNFLRKKHIKSRF